MAQKSANKETEKKRWLKVPHVFVLLFIIVLIAVALTYIIPAGEFERTEDPESGNEVVQEGAYQLVDEQPVSIFEIAGLFIRGVNEVAVIILCVLLVGGS